MNVVEDEQWITGEAMVTFLFWNIKAKPLENRIRRLVVSYEVDVLILAESEITPYQMLVTLNQQSDPMFHHIQDRIGECDKIAIYSRFRNECFTSQYESNRLTIRRLKLPGIDEILLAATHFPSKLWWAGDDQFAESIVLAQTIRQIEEDVGHSRTILVGDFNMNPFEKGVVAANGLHGVMTRKVAQGQSRRVEEKDYSFFYNPMWGLFGDGSEGPSGTYYYRHSGHVSYFWNIFDQVLIRPALLPLFRNSELKVLTDDGAESLLTRHGLPDVSGASDHLPLLFKLDL